MIEQLKRNILNFVCKKNEQGFPYRYNEWGKIYFIAPALNDYEWGNVKAPITKQQVIDWVDELRSGNYEQGEGKLRDSSDTRACFCCLGVLAESRNELNFDECFNPHGMPGNRIPQGGYLRVLTRQDYSQEYYYLPQELQRKLANMNDSKLMFREIADFLEKEFAL